MWGIVLGIIGWIGNAAVSIANAVWAALTAVWGVFGPIIRGLWTGVRDIWSDALKPFWRLVQSVFEKLREWIDRVIGPLKEWIKTIYQIERDIYEGLFRPILDTLSRLRQFLEITGLSHTALGHAIEDALGTIYNDINNVYQAITQPINSLIRQVETYILTAQGLLQTPLLLNSLFANIGSVWRLWWNTGIKPLSDDGRRALAKLAKHRHVHEISLEATAYLLTRSGSYVQPIEQATRVFLQVLEGRDPPTSTSGAGES